MSQLTSKDLYRRALESVPAGTHSNSRASSPHPTYAARAEGAYLWDVSGHRFTDYQMGNGAVMLGHRNPAVNDAVKRALDAGLGAGYESELSVTVAEAFLQLVPTAERVRFTNTGTEAAIHAVHIARAITGRPGIAKVEGAYHGWWDDVFVSTWPDLSRAGDGSRPLPLAGGNGLSATAVQSATILPFNDLEAATRILRERHGAIAALFIEPTMIDVGFIPTDREYLQGLRTLTQELGIVLIFDELLTGFRLARGGAQELYNVTPDLSMWGKALANGFPIAALAGTKAAMERSAPGEGNAPFVGTFNGFRPALAAAKATLEQLRDGSVSQRLNERSAQLADAFGAIAKEHGVAAILQTGGGHFQPYFTDRAVVDYRSAASTDARMYEHWRRTLAERGLLVAGKALLHSAFSAAHRDEDFDAFLEATRTAFEARG